VTKIPKRFLLVGPMPPPNGGATVLFEHLVNYLCIQDYIIVTVDTSPAIAGAQQSIVSKFLSRFWRLFKVVYLILLNLKQSDILFLNVSKSGFAFFLPLGLVLCKVFSKKLVVRKFGGDFYDEMLSRGKKSLTFRFLGYADKVFFETKRELELYKTLSNKCNVSWFPNCREFSSELCQSEITEEAVLKVVFVGEVKEDKGIEILLDADLNDLSVQVDVYGPLCKGVDETSFGRNSKVFYRGVLSRDVINQTLSKYDCLILPTFYKGEGYPGVILEAFGAGLAVITTEWNAIPELIEDGQNGILLPVKDSLAIRNAFSRLLDSPLLLSDMKSKAFLCIEYYEVNSVHRRVIKEIEAIE
jgi:glycosyltransferase involved in cell wall biosynthesis